MRVGALCFRRCVVAAVAVAVAVRGAAGALAAVAVADLAAVVAVAVAVVAVAIALARAVASQASMITTRCRRHHEMKFGDAWMIEKPAYVAVYERDSGV